MYMITVLVVEKSRFYVASRFSSIDDEILTGSAQPRPSGFFTVGIT